MKKRTHRVVFRAAKVGVLGGNSIYQDKIPDNNHLSLSPKAFFFMFVAKPNPPFSVSGHSFGFGRLKSMRSCMFVTGLAKDVLYHTPAID
jgi:hypothetical protein